MFCCITKMLYICTVETNNLKNELERNEKNCY